MLVLSFPHQIVSSHYLRSRTGGKIPWTCVGACDAHGRCFCHKKNLLQIPLTVTGWDEYNSVFADQVLTENVSKRWRLPTLQTWSPTNAIIQNRGMERRAFSPRSNGACITGEEGHSGVGFQMDRDSKNEWLAVMREITSVNRLGIDSTASTPEKK